MARCLAAELLLVALAAAAAAAVSAPRAPAAARCPATVPARQVPPDADGKPAFNYGGDRLRVQLGWPKGTLAAGDLPGGGSYATVEDDGSIHAKAGWWRGVAGKLRIAGRRLDTAAPPLRAHAPDGYGLRGFQPSGLTFPTTGCWRVTGAVGSTRLTFVVRVVKLVPR